MTRGVAAKATLRFQGRDGVLGRGRFLQSSGGLAGQRLLGLLLEPLRPVGGLGGE